MFNVLDQGILALTYGLMGVERGLRFSPIGKNNLQRVARQRTRTTRHCTFQGVSKGMCIHNGHAHK
jgi:hypothetical protein